MYMYTVSSVISILHHHSVSN